MAYDDIKIEVLTKFLYPGMLLKGDGYDENGDKVISKDVPLREEEINKLKILGVEKITYTRERLKMKKATENPMISEKHMEEAWTLIDDIEGAIRKNKEHIPVKQIEMLIDDFVGDIRDNNDACLNLLDIADYDDYTYTHSINVSSLCIVIALALNLDEEKINLIGTAGLLHDIGKTLVPIELINKEGPLEPDEWELVKKHPVYGYNILKAEGKFNLKLLNGVLLHHENYQGQGYPFGVTSDKTNSFAQIISVADVFDAITSKRSYKEAQPYDEAFGFIMENSGSKFHPRIAQVFLKDLVKKINEAPLYPENSYILLNTGEIAYVIGFRQSPYTLRPIVNIFFNPAKKEKFLKFPQQIDLENDYERTVVKRITDSAYIKKFNQILDVDFG